MNPNETSVNGTRPIIYNREQTEQPETSNFNPMESSVSDFSYTPDDYQELYKFFFKTDQSDSTLCNGPCLCGNCHKVLESQPSFPDDSSPWNDIFPLLGTECDHGSSPPMVSPVSTYSCPTMHSTPEDTEAQNAMEGAESVIDNNSGNCINLSNPENSVVPSELCKPGCSRTCPGCVRPASSCHDAHRLTASEVEIRGQEFFKGVNKKKKSDKWTCEIRISKKLLENSELEAKEKVWLGTFDTPCQAARALHAGRFLLSEKKKKKNSATDATDIEQRSKTILSDFKDRMREKPLDTKLLDSVKKLALEYGKNGFL